MIKNTCIRWTKQSVSKYNVRAVCCTAPVSDFKRIKRRDQINSNKQSYFVHLSTQTKSSKWVEKLNNSIAASPSTGMITFLGMRAATWYGLVFLLNTDVIPLHFGAEYAMAYLVMRVSGKLRQPLNVVFAAGLHKAFPVLSTIKASALMGMIAPPPSAQAEREKPPTKFELKMKKFADVVNGPLDKYGFSYYLAAKMSITVVLFGTAGLINHGIDIQSYLTEWGVSDKVQNGAGSMAGATLLNLLNLPLHLYLLPYALTGMHQLQKEVTTQMFRKTTKKM